MRRILLGLAALLLASAPSALAAGDVQPLADGMYAFHGVETKHGPQCVEYAERYYVTRYPGTFPFHNSGPGAFDIWEGIADGKDVGGWASLRRHFAAYENGTACPQPEDMLLYDRTRGSGYGHVAIIAEVNPASVVVLEQNYGHDTRRVLPLFGHRILDRGVRGVVRLKSNDAAM
ncbi:CHAP domain-containing protein [Tumebacillus sp. BK434]|uniref:CHAP domain-containing protein n=1 Tax=Tumebacillus sp. BK434 TaxID=2512169 RepID=UPI00105324DA|nr:CHAP domain-containing protein [Tumebacillus sp. BK434]TCP53940.1 CHAP domain-containing protein [Tumebacillus sp. BK434]